MQHQQILKAWSYAWSYVIIAIPTNIETIQEIYVVIALSTNIAAM